MSIIIAAIWVNFWIMNTIMSFSDRLDYALKLKGYKQADLARELDISRAAVSYLMSGQNKGMRPEHLVRTADWLGVRIEWLATGEGEIHPRRLSLQQRALLAITDQMPPESLESLIHMLAQMTATAFPAPTRRSAP